jgi:hypothetical protein
MSLSGSTDFRTNSGQVIDAALRVLGVIRSGDTSNNDVNMESDCFQALNLMLKSWQNYGIQLWKRKAVTVPLTAGTASYTVKVGGTVNIATPLRIVDAYRRSSTNNDTMMTVLSRNEYDFLSNKSAAGTPTQWFYDYLDTQGVLYPWPVPDSNTNMVIVYQAPYDDSDTTNNDLDYPAQWQEAVKWNLAVRLAPEFGRPLTPEIVALASTTLKEAIEGSYEEASVFFRPSYRLYHR